VDPNRNFFLPASPIQLTARVGEPAPLNVNYEPVALIDPARPYSAGVDDAVVVVNAVDGVEKSLKRQSTRS
jgi:hypothetical protein